MNILLVEPDRVLGQSAKEALEAFGYKVLWRRSAQTALDALDENDENRIDILVLELQLGTHNGVELLYEIASYPEWKQIPVIVHSINPKVQDDTFAEAFSQLQVREILYKPTTNSAKLVNTVKQFA